MNSSSNHLINIIKCKTCNSNTWQQNSLKYKCAKCGYEYKIIDGLILILSTSDDKQRKN